MLRICIEGNIVLCDVLGKQIINKLKIDLNLANTLDAYLVKLSSLILYLKDSCKIQDDVDKCINICLKSILTNLELVDHMKLLTCYYSDIHNEVHSSPRYKLIRTYWDKVDEVLKALSCENWKPLNRTSVYSRIEEIRRIEQDHAIPVKVTTRNKRKTTSNHRRLFITIYYNSCFYTNPTFI